MEDVGLEMETSQVMGKGMGINWSWSAKASWDLSGEMEMHDANLARCNWRAWGRSRKRGHEIGEGPEKGDMPSLHSRPVPGHGQDKDKTRQGIKQGQTVSYLQLAPHSSHAGEGTCHYVSVHRAYLGV